MKLTKDQLNLLKKIAIAKLSNEEKKEFTSKIKEVISNRG